MEDFLKKLAELGIKISDPTLYETAFTHRSLLNESKNTLHSNERLEFLGDSVLSFVVSSFLYASRPQDAEGDLTNLRAYIVKTESLAKAAKNLNLGHFLKVSRGEEVSGGKENTQTLANTYEALTGAVYIDLGIETVRKFIDSTLFPLFEKEIKEGAPKDCKSQLQEIVQSQHQVSPKYKVLDTSGPDHSKEFKVGVFIKEAQVGEGTGSSKQTAEEQAAKAALTKLTL